MKWLAIMPLALALVACGDGDTATTTTLGESTTSATTSLPEPTTTAASGGPSVVFGIVSGRGDDQSFEVAAYFDAPQGTTRIVIGIDSDDSFDGEGDPTADMEGWAEFGDTVVVGADGGIVAGGSSEGIGDWMSWGTEGSAVRLFFIQEVAPITGTLWVVVGDGSGVGSVAGVVTGESCSVRGSTLDVLPGDEVPDPGIACLYP